MRREGRDKIDRPLVERSPCKMACSSHSAVFPGRDVSFNLYCSQYAMLRYPEVLTDRSGPGRSPPQNPPCTLARLPATRCNAGTLLVRSLWCGCMPPGGLVRRCISISRFFAARLPLFASSQGTGTALRRHIPLAPVIASSPLARLALWEAVVGACLCPLAMPTLRESFVGVQIRYAVES